MLRQSKLYGNRELTTNRRLYICRRTFAWCDFTISIQFWLTQFRSKRIGRTFQYRYLAKIPISFAGNLGSRSITLTKNHNMKNWVWWRSDSFRMYSWNCHVPIYQFLIVTDSNHTKFFHVKIWRVSKWQYTDIANDLAVFSKKTLDISTFRILHPGWLA